MPYFKNQDPQNPIVHVIKNTIFPDAEPIGVGASFQLLCAGWAGVRCKRFDSKAEADLLFKGKLCELAAALPGESSTRYGSGGIRGRAWP